MSCILGVSLAVSKSDANLNSRRIYIVGVYNSQRNYFVKIVGQ